MTLVIHKGELIVSVYKPLGELNKTLEAMSVKDAALLTIAISRMDREKEEIETNK